MIAYFISYAGNKFVRPHKIYYPICKSMDENRLKKSVYQLSVHMLDKGFKQFSDYAALGWMYDVLPNTTEAYENAIRWYYFAVCSCRDVDESQLNDSNSSYYWDFWRDDLEISVKENIGFRDSERLQMAYLELAKLVFLPFLYGYTWNVTFQTPIYNKIVFDLIKVSKGAIPTPSDIREIVQCIIEIGTKFPNPETLNSPYLRSRVDEYVSLYDAKTKAMKNKRK